MSRVYNFSAGPAVLPVEVLKEAQEEMMDYRGCGMSVMEMSHRSSMFQEIIDEAEADLRDLMGIPDNYKVLFLQGGASQQFAMIPMNLMKNRVADYIVTGQWAKKAAKEAEHSKTDKGVLSRLSRLFEKAQKGFASLEQKAMDTADKLRVSRVKSSVKENLSRYRAAAKAEKGTERSEPTASKEENRTAQALGQISVPHPQKSNLSKER